MFDDFFDENAFCVKMAAGSPKRTLGNMNFKTQNEKKKTPENEKCVKLEWEQHAFF